MRALDRALDNLAVRVMLVVFTGTLASSGLSAIGHAESFDKPTRQMKVDLGPRHFQGRVPDGRLRVTLKCFYYPGFMVKQLEEDQVKGTLGVKIVGVTEGHVPGCKRLYVPTERVLAKDWWSFIGAKGNLVFLEAADGDENQGMPFKVIDVKTGRTIFEDSQWPSKSEGLEFARNSSGRLALSYLRNVSVGCSIPKGGTTCWAKFREKFGLVISTLPKCTNYLGESRVTAEDIEAPSVIGYPASVDLFPRPSVKAVIGKVECSQL